MKEEYDVIIIGSGPNGLAAATYLQKQGYRTAIFEQADKPGGAARTEETTLPGFKHDLGSAVHPLGFASPYFKTLPLEDYGLKWIHPEIPFAHPFEDGSAFGCYKDIHKTAAQLGEDKQNYLDLLLKFVEEWLELEEDLLAPLRIPQNLEMMFRFGLKALPSAKFIAERSFKEERSKIFFYGAAAHSTLPLSKLVSSSFGLVLTILAHRHGWPFPQGGAVKIVDALLAYYTEHGGKLFLNQPVTDLEKLPQSRSFILDLTPKQILELKNTNLSETYRNRLKKYDYGAGIFKMDWALNNPIPFTNELCRKAGTVHLGYSKQSIEDSEAAAHENRICEEPYVLLAQPTVFDSSRAPEGKHVAWAYCHVPNGNTEDVSPYIEEQIERAAPGFKKSIIARSTMRTDELQALNPNLIGGDINGGKQDITQLFTRPIASLDPYATSNPKIFIGSSSTPPGGGVHGMCGYHAAKSAERFLKK
ncbi:phytoene desaturase family protein [Christiangramia portivictoriae]|uniref:phytoene desaturase family protein n=1 Tax=Christiangramia portivictoriae TaxID=326069 RepID=UPI000418BEEB|nr:NAD(P)/FAD-dependent oxidoreductase [Christiangramia portivictoriae]